MENELRGVVEITLAGTTRRLRFSMNTLRLMQRRRKVELGEMLQSFQGKKDPGAMIDLMFDLIYCGLQNEAHYQGQEWNVSEEQLEAQIGDLSQEDLLSVFTAFSKAIAQGNAIAPAPARPGSKKERT